MFERNKDIEQNKAHITHSNSSSFVQLSYIASYKVLYNGLGVSE